MGRVRIRTGGKTPADIEQYLEKAVKAVRVAQDRDFSDPEMQQAYDEEQTMFEAILDAMMEDIEALQ